jgi:hypothetical protein
MHKYKRSSVVISTPVRAICVLILIASMVSVAATTDGSQQKHTSGQSTSRGQTKGKSGKEPPKPSVSLWPPVDVDSSVPPVSPQTTCQLQEVLNDVRRRVEDLVANLDRFAATETIDSSEIGKDGRTRNSLVYKFNYLATISQTRGGDLEFDENRIPIGKSNPVPRPIRTVGLALGAAIFHPQNIKDLDILCEGLGEWHGAPAWQLHFQERSDKPSRFQAVYADGTWSDVKLKGRAWVGAESGQIEQMEFDLLRPIPRIKLVTEHMSVEYCAVDFVTRDEELWLPKSVELYIDIGGHRYVNRQHLANYLLFAVETKQEFQLPRGLN